jgi:hypothetical protein
MSDYVLDSNMEQVIQDGRGGHLGFCPIGPDFELAKVSLTVNPHTISFKYIGQYL